MSRQTENRRWQVLGVMADHSWWSNRQCDHSLLSDLIAGLIFVAFLTATQPKPVSLI
jgi:hypothetical protein